MVRVRLLRYSCYMIKILMVITIAALITGGILYGLFLLSLLVSLFGGTPYMSIPKKSVRKILAFGELDAHDVFCDLGSGNGRVLIEAAGYFGVARAEGFEIAPWPYFVSRLRVALRGREKRIVIHYKSFLKADVSSASFVYVYLYRKILNEKVALKLARELQRGAKVLSCSSPLDTALHPQFRLLKTGTVGHITVFLYEKM